MTNILVHRYLQHPDREPPYDWLGYIEPEDRSWIMFIKGDNTPVVYLNRDETGAVIAEDAYVPFPGWRSAGESKDFGPSSVPVS